MYRKIDLGEVYWKAGQIKHYFFEVEAARTYYGYALENIRGENIKKIISDNLDSLELIKRSNPTENLDNNGDDDDYNNNNGEEFKENHRGLEERIGEDPLDEINEDGVVEQNG